MSEQDGDPYDLEGALRGTRKAAMQCHARMLADVRATWFSMACQLLGATFNAAVAAYCVSSYQEHGTVGSLVGAAISGSTTVLSGWWASGTLARWLRYRRALMDLLAHEAFLRQRIEQEVQ